MDWGNDELNIADGDQMDIVEKLKTFRGTIIIHRNPIPNNVTFKGLQHGEVIKEIDNGLLANYKRFAGTCFSDYAGTKKNEITDGGGRSPGFFYYDATKNEFYGFKGNKGLDDKVGLEEFKLTIVPDIIRSAATQRMKIHFLNFLGPSNKGWKMIQTIHDDENVSGESATVFKRIGIEHYLHCIKVKIENGDFD